MEYAHESFRGSRAAHWVALPFLLSTVIGACTAPPEPSPYIELIGRVGDGPFEERPVRLNAFYHLPLDPGSFAVYSWPELDRVASTTEITNDTGAYQDIVVSPDPIELRWYAVRFDGDAGDLSRLYGGIRLNDGTFIWRFYDALVAEPRTLAIADEPGGAGGGDAVLAYTYLVQAPVGDSVESYPTLSQGTTLCTTLPEGYRTAAFRFDCGGALERTSPVRVVVRDGLMSTSGYPVAPLDMTVTPGASGAVQFETMQSPRVPSELCAGEEWDCE